MSTPYPWYQYYPDGALDALADQPSTLLAAWQEQVRTRPEAASVHYFDATLTFTQADRAADALAAGLLALGVRPGDRIALFLQNDPQWLVALLAAWKTGGIAVAINPMLVGSELRHQLTDSGATVLICLQDLYDVARGILPETGVQETITTHPLDLTPSATIPTGLTQHVRPERAACPEGSIDWVELLSSHEGQRFPVHAVHPSDTAILTYTSGTTGRAKGAMNVQSAMVHSSSVYTHWWGLGPEQDVLICMAPVFHITGSISGFGVHMVSGAPLVLMHRFDPGTTLATIEARAGTFMVAASTAYIALANHPELRRDAVASLTKTLSGGAPVSQSLVDRIREKTGWTLRGAYGLTETNSPTHLGPGHLTPPVDPDSGALSVGVPVPGAEVRIVDPETGVDLPPGEAGEIVVRGPMVVPGYWQLPEESAHAIRDGWLHTGDIGKTTEDGWLFVVDRLKDLINAGGYKVYPRDVEDVLYGHPAVREAAVIGVADEYRGETVKAVISLLPGHHATPEELMAFCKERMSAYKYPRIVEIIDELPKNASGKLLRRQLRDQAESRSATEGARQS